MSDARGPERALADRAREALRVGDAARAEALARQCIASQPDSASSWELDSDVAFVVGDGERSLASARCAAELRAPATPNWLRIARALRALHRHDELQSALERARSAARTAEDFAYLGDFQTLLEDFTAAMDAFDQAVTRAPENARYLFNRAAVRRYLGDLEGAERDYDRVIEIDPRETEAWLNRSDLRRQSPERNHVAELDALLAGGFTSWLGEVPIRFALAKEYEDLHDYAQSWRQLSAGAALRRRHLQYDVRTDVETVDWIIDAYPSTPRAGLGCETHEPIFIVGMPRTGTTLLERLLSGHPDVFAAGELNHFAAALVAAIRLNRVQGDLSRRDLIRASATVDFKALGEDYLARGRPRTGRRPRFIDKMPLNYLYCGLMHRALPNARIIHLTRHPLDTCYAVYKVLFNQGYPFSYDLREIADYYVAYRRLMEHWHRTLPGVILDVSYERLVTDTESETCRVFEFCGLEWNRSYLDFHLRQEPTTTASASQVRQPIHQRSVGLWKHYQTGLEPVAARLRESGIPVPD